MPGIPAAPCFICDISIWDMSMPGMFIALPILVVASALAGDEFKIKDAIINSIVLTAGSWVIFIWGLKLTIPLLPAFLAR